MKFQFANALLQAQGIDTGDDPADLAGPGGRSHAGETRARATGQGQLMVSQIAVRKIGSQPGEVFAVSYPGNRSILLTATGVIEPVVARGGRKAAEQSAEQPGTPLFDQDQAA